MPLILPIPQSDVITSSGSAIIVNTGPAPSPVIKVITEHSPIINGFDIRTLIGISGFTFIESFVEYLKNQWYLPSYLAPVVAFLSAIALNEAIAYYLHMDLFTALITGVLTGVLASGWHEATKPKI